MFQDNLRHFNMTEGPMNARAFHSRFHSLAAFFSLLTVILPLAACTGRQSGSGPLINSSAEIWFHPRPTAAAWPGGQTGVGSTDFLSLFQANAPWPRAIANTPVFGVYAGWITAISNQELQTFVSFLSLHNMGIEIEGPAMQAQATCGSGVEGYVPYGLSLHDFTLSYLQRLQALGAHVLYVKVDEPYFFGNVVDDPRSCNFSVTEIATQVSQYSQLVATVYPNALVGDVEPVIATAYPTDVVTALGDWHDTYEQVNGAPFPFFFADIDFTNPAWPAIVKQMEDATHQSGSHFGIIYIGDWPDTSDAEWSSKSIARFQTYQGNAGGQPDYVLFQSWQPHPLLCLPESNPTTFTGVIDAYIDATN
jgi:hypothetical protein